jgi:hypothetical protein
MWQRRIWRERGKGGKRKRGKGGMKGKTEVREAWRERCEGGMKGKRWGRYEKEEVRGKGGM